VGLDDGEGCGGLVDLAAFYADQAVFDHVYPTRAVSTGDAVKLSDQLDQRELRTIEARGQALLEADLYVARLVRRLLGSGGEFEDVLCRLVVGVF
jgi:hypothetical protein